MGVIVRGRAPQYLISDDFDGSAVDTALWDVHSNQSVTVNNGAITLNKTNDNSSYMAFLYSKMIYDGVSDYEVEFDVVGMTGSVYEPDFGIFAPCDGLVRTDSAAYLNPSINTNNTGMRIWINGSFLRVTGPVKTAFKAKFVYKTSLKTLEVYVDDKMIFSGTYDFTSYAGTRLCFARVTGSYAKSISVGKIIARNLSSLSYEAVNREVSAITAGAPDGVNRTIRAAYRAAGGVVRLVFGTPFFPPLDPPVSILQDDDYFAQMITAIPYAGGSSGSSTKYTSYSTYQKPPYGSMMYELVCGPNASSNYNCTAAGVIHVPTGANKLIVIYARNPSTGSSAALAVKINGASVLTVGNTTDTSWKTAQLDISDYQGQEINLSITASFGQSSRGYGINRIYFTS